jgi:hypothetical protein
MMALAKSQMLKFGSLVQLMCVISDTDEGLCTNTELPMLDIGMVIFKVRYCVCDVSALFYIGIGG